VKSASSLVTWIPPFVVGLSAAVAGELAVGLLLYATPGFLRALTLILAVLLGSLALGLWTSLPPSEERYTESLRRRWLLTLISYAGGSAVSGAWSLQRGLSEDMLSRGAGLALLAALPLYASGALLGAMPSRRWPWARRIPVGASATAGACVGTVLAGYVLISWLLPVSIYAFCLVLLSAGALIHGLILTAAGERRVLLTVPSPYGRVRVEEWTWGKRVRPVRVLLENERVRGAEDAEGWPARRWEEAALDLATRSLTNVGGASMNGSGPPAAEGSVSAAADDSAGASAEASAGDGAGAAPTMPLEPSAPCVPDESSGSTEAATSDESSTPSEAPSSPPAHGSAPARVLVLGGGMFTLARQVLDRHDYVTVDATERNPAIVAVGAEHLALPSNPRLRIVDTDPLASLEPLSGPYRVTLVDGTGLPFGAPVPLPGQSWLKGLRALTADEGIVMLGGIERVAATGLPLEQLLADGGTLFPAVALYTARTEPGPVTRPAVGEAPARQGELLLVFSPDPGADFPADVRGLTLESVQRTVAAGSAPASTPDVDPQEGPPQP
jgi:hypothetical protein